MRDFDTLDKVKALLRDPWSPALKQPKVAVLVEKEKLAYFRITSGQLSDRSCRTMAASGSFSTEFSEFTIITG